MRYQRLLLLLPVESDQRSESDHPEGNAERKRSADVGAEAVEGVAPVFRGVFDVEDVSRRVDLACEEGLGRPCQTNT